MNRAETFCKIDIVPAFYLIEMAAQRGHDRNWQHRSSVFPALGIPNNNVQVLKVHIFDAQTQAFEQTQSTAIKQLCH